MQTQKTSPDAIYCHLLPTIAWRPYYDIAPQRTRYELSATSPQMLHTELYRARQDYSAQRT